MRLMRKIFGAYFAVIVWFYLRKLRWNLLWEGEREHLELPVMGLPVVRYMPVLGQREGSGVDDAELAMRIYGDGSYCTRLPYQL